jgi:uncharacterized membrane protein
MVSGFHGNTDPLVVAILLLSIWLAESGRPAWLAGAVFGMAMNIKVVPILFAPAFLLYLRGTRRRIDFAVAAGAVFLTGSLPYIAQDPALVIHRLFGYDPALVIYRLFGYAPVTATWGLSQIGSIFLPKGGYEVYLAVGKAILLLIVLWASFWMNRGARKPALFLQCGFVALLFIFWTPGFGVQYLAWLVPWSAGLDGRRLQCYYALSGAFLFMKYTWWSRGFPWFLANSFDPGPLFWAGMLAIPLGLACWISVGAVAHKLKIRLSESA